jgi:hypothetical protein
MDSGTERTNGFCFAYRQAGAPSASAAPECTQPSVPGAGHAQGIAAPSSAAAAGGGKRSADAFRRRIGAGIGTAMVATGEQGISMTCHDKFDEPKRAQTAAEPRNSANLCRPNDLW